MEDKEISKDEELSKDHAVYSMGFSKEELELLDEALRSYLVENLDNVSEYAFTGNAEVMLDRLRGDVLKAVELLMRITNALCTFYDAEDGEKEEERGEK